MKKELKEQVIESVSTLLGEYPNFYITDIAGLNAEQTTKLRRNCFEQNIKLNVVKNTLFSIALKKVGNEEMQQLLPTLEGNTAIMYTETPNAPAKLIKKLLKEGFEKPVIKGAYVQECAFVGTDKLEELAAIKSKEELIGDIIAMLQSPAQRVISALENASEGLGEDDPIIKAATPSAAAEEAPAAEQAPAAEPEEAPAAPEAPAAEAEAPAAE